MVVGLSADVGGIRWLEMGSPRLTRSHLQRGFHAGSHVTEEECETALQRDREVTPVGDAREVHRKLTVIGKERKQ